jgi:LytS/YehU family sensor histidine kinase
MTAVDGSYWVDRLDKPGVGSVVVFDALGSLLLFSLTLLAWVAVTHDQSITPRARLTRLVLAVVASGIVTAFATVSMAHAYGLHEVIWNLLEKKQSMPPAWMIVSSSAVQLSLFAGLFVATGEMLQRRRATQLALHAAQREQAEVARGVLESRLAAMQAQVEPQFLFDTLVDIEAQYRRDAVRASDDLDRLITYLRVALPRLRESGSYVEAEIGLVQAYLEVVRSLRGGRPELTVNLAEDCRCARFYPMLLLPLVQRAVRQPAERLPASMRIDVQRAGDKVEIVLIVAQSAGCVEDAELARVRERVVGLYGARATFECSELTDGTTTFKLLIPDEPVCDQ